MQNSEIIRLQLCSPFVKFKFHKNEAVGSFEEEA